jgi:hypothetical protein
MAIKVSDISDELKREILNHLHDQLGDTQFMFLKEELGEDGMLELFLESVEKAGHQDMNYITPTSKSDRKPLLKQVLLWTLVIGSFFGFGLLVFAIVIPLYDLLMKELRRQAEFINNGLPPYYRSKKDNHVNDNNDSDAIIYIGALVGIFTNWIVFGKLRGEYLLFIIYLLIMIFIINLFGHFLYRIIKYRDRKLLVQGTFTLFLLILALGLFWQFFPDASLSVIENFSLSNIDAILAQ